MSSSQPNQPITKITSLFKPGMAMSLLTFVTGVVAGVAIPVFKQGLQTGVTDADFSSSPVANLLCRQDESANAMLEQRNFVQSEWTGLSSLGGQTHVWMQATTAQYLIVRTDGQGMTCFLDTGQF